MDVATILLIEDEWKIRRVVRDALADQGVRIIEAATGHDGVRLALSENPELVVLDLGLPDTGGSDVCRAIRKESPVPILVLSARHSENEKVLLLNVGADDYVTKPFSTAELRARVRALLRRAHGPTVGLLNPIEIDGLTIDLSRRSVSRDSKAIHLTPIEWALLRAFLERRGRTLTHTQIFRAVWNQSAGDPQLYLRVHVANLRRKIERDSLRPELILTEPGVGYRFSDADGPRAG
jgi:Response regulators consisting of a CheY-like receiver domain and a winged-helix DNA-binding domain